MFQPYFSNIITPWTTLPQEVFGIAPGVLKGSTIGIQFIEKPLRCSLKKKNEASDLKLQLMIRRKDIVTHIQHCLLCNKSLLESEERQRIFRGQENWSQCLFLLSNNNSSFTQRHDCFLFRKNLKEIKLFPTK